MILVMANLLKPLFEPKMLLILIVSLIAIYGTSLVFFPILGALFSFLTSKESVVSLLGKLVPERQAQLACGERLAGWLEKMSAAFLVGYVVAAFANPEVVGNPLLRLAIAILVALSIISSLSLTNAMAELATTSDPAAAATCRPARRRPCPRTSRSRVYRRKTRP